MPAQPYFDVSTTVAELTDGLTDGSDYVAQNVAGADVEYLNYATDPTDEDVGWHIVRSFEYIFFTVDAANPVWVRVRHGVGALAVSDG